MKKRPLVLLFDVNETLLNLSDMQEAVNKAFNNKLAFNLWFSQLLEYSLVENVTVQYHDFGEVGKAVMQMTNRILETDISEEKQKELIKMVQETKPHADVIPGLQSLKDAGYRMATLTNSPAKSSIPHLKEAGLSSFFEASFSVDSVKKFKPHKLPYEYVAEQMNVSISDIMMIAAHGWDMAGASNAGMRTAFIERPGKVLYPLAPAPELTAPNLVKLSEQLTAMK